MSPQVRHLIIFSDNAAGQNKNRVVFALLQELANSKCDVVTINFPIPGHSFLPINRDFAILEKKRRKVDRAIAPSTWTIFIKEAKIAQPFELVFVEKAFTDNLAPDHTTIVRVKDYKNALNPLFHPRANIADIRGLQFTRGLVVLACTEYDVGFVHDWNPYVAHVSPATLHEAKEGANHAYDENTFLAVPNNAKNDVNMLLDYVDLPQNVIFYDSIQLNYV